MSSTTNIIVLSCLNLDLIDLPEFTQQFVANNNTGQNHLFLIDHLGGPESTNKSSGSIPFTLNYKPTPGVLKHSGTSVPRHSEAQPEGWAYNRVLTVSRIDINKFIADEIENELLTPKLDDSAKNQKITTHQVYKEYIAYLQRANTPNRRLIENIFYTHPEYIEFIKYYMFSILKLVSLAQHPLATKTKIISCDPLFHYLLEGLRTYNPAAVDEFYKSTEIQVWEPPIGWPLAYPPGIAITKLTKNTFARFKIPYLQQTHTSEVPLIITEFRADNDIYNLDLLTDYIKAGNNNKFKGAIKGVLGLDDIKTGLDHIFQDGLITQQLRVPRHLLPLQEIREQKIAFEITIFPQQIPYITDIRVLSDLYAQQLDPDLVNRYKTMVSRELKLLLPELENLALEYELRIQKHIKLPIIINLAS